MLLIAAVSAKMLTLAFLINLALVDRSFIVLTDDSSWAWVLDNYFEMVDSTFFM